MRLVGRRWRCGLRWEEGIGGRKNRLGRQGRAGLVLGCGRGRGDFETCEIHIDTIGLQGSQAEYELLFLQPSGGIVVALQEAQDGHVV